MITVHVYTMNDYCTDFVLTQLIGMSLLEKTSLRRNMTMMCMFSVVKGRWM